MAHIIEWITENCQRETFQCWINHKLFPFKQKKSYKKDDGVNRNDLTEMAEILSSDHCKLLVMLEAIANRGLPTKSKTDRPKETLFGGDALHDYLVSDMLPLVLISMLFPRKDPIMLASLNNLDIGKDLFQNFMEMVYRNKSFLCKDEEFTVQNEKESELMVDKSRVWLFFTIPKEKILKPRSRKGHQTLLSATSDLHTPNTTEALTSLRIDSTSTNEPTNPEGNFKHDANAPASSSELEGGEDEEIRTYISLPLITLKQFIEDVVQDDNKLLLLRENIVHFSALKNLREEVRSKIRIKSVQTKDGEKISHEEKLSDMISSFEHEDYDFSIKVYIQYPINSFYGIKDCLHCQSAHITIIDLFWRALDVSCRKYLYHFKGQEFIRSDSDNLLKFGMKNDLEFNLIMTQATKLDARLVTGALLSSIFKDNAEELKSKVCKHFGEEGHLSNTVGCMTQLWTDYTKKALEIPIPYFEQEKISVCPCNASSKRRKIMQDQIDTLNYVKNTSKNNSDVVNDDDILEIDDNKVVRFKETATTHIRLMSIANNYTVSNTFPYHDFPSYVFRHTVSMVNSSPFKIDYKKDEWQDANFDIDNSDVEKVMKKLSTMKSFLENAKTSEDIQMKEYFTISECKGMAYNFKDEFNSSSEMVKKYIDSFKDEVDVDFVFDNTRQIPECFEAEFSEKEHHSTGGSSDSNSNNEADSIPKDSAKNVMKLKFEKDKRDVAPPNILEVRIIKEK